MSHGYVAVRAGKRNAGYNRVSENVRSPPVDRTLFHNRNRLSNKESIEIVCQLGRCPITNGRNCLRGDLIFFLMSEFNIAEV